LVQPRCRLFHDITCDTVLGTKREEKRREYFIEAGREAVKMQIASQSVGDSFSSCGTWVTEYYYQSYRRWYIRGDIIIGTAATAVVWACGLCMTATAGSERAASYR
jgi:hypothetical protein